jgi:hypothetical protein
MRKLLVFLICAALLCSCVSTSVSWKEKGWKKEHPADLFVASSDGERWKDVCDIWMPEVADTVSFASFLNERSSGRPFLFLGTAEEATSLNVSASADFAGRIDTMTSLETAQSLLIAWYANKPAIHVEFKMKLGYPYEND